MMARLVNLYLQTIQRTTLPLLFDQVCNTIKGHHLLSLKRLCKFDLARHFLLLLIISHNYLSGVAKSS